MHDLFLPSPGPAWGQNVGGRKFKRVVLFNQEVATTYSFPCCLESLAENASPDDPYLCVVFCPEPELDQLSQNAKYFCHAGRDSFDCISDAFKALELELPYDRA